MKYTSKLILNGTEYEFGAGGGGWTPDSSNIVYFSLKDDLKDYTGTYTLTANNGAIISTVDGVKCLDCTSSNSYANCNIPTLPQGGAERTNMIWVRWKALGTYPAWQYGQSGNYKGDVIWHNDITWDTYNGIGWSQYGGNVNGGNTTVVDTWYHIAVVAKNGEQKIYINGVLGQSNSLTMNTVGTTLYLGRCNRDNTFLNGYLSDFIVENRMWTEQEIQDYFNQTKSLYGIS